MYQHAPIYLRPFQQVMFVALLTISWNGCAGQVIFSPQSKVDLKNAVAACLDSRQDLDCSDGAQGSIGEWDVSRVTNKSDVFISQIACHRR